MTSLTAADVARLAGVSPERVEQLVAVGVLVPDGTGGFSSSDALCVRAVDAMEQSGLALADVARAVVEGHLSFAYLDFSYPPPALLDETYAEFSARVGLAFPLLERVYMASGLVPPLPDDLVRADDAEPIEGIAVVVREFGEVEMVRAARLYGEAQQRLGEYQVHLFHTVLEDRFRASGVPERDLLEVALREVGARTGPIGEQLVSWLYRRHSEVFSTQHRVEHGELALEHAGVRPRPRRDDPAIVFFDISGYTSLTEAFGDRAAVELPMRLAGLVQDTVARCGGRTLKWLGDGVELHFPRPVDAVRCALELIERVHEVDVPAAHAGIAAGPLLYEDGDYYGRTVILAARIAAHARPHEVIVSEAVVHAVAADDLRFERRAPVVLKGIAEPVALYEVARP